MTAAHTERETLKVEVNIPGHADRATTALFRKTRLKLIAREGGRCWICGRTEEEAGHPIESHHHPIERSLAEMVDWGLFIADAKAGVWGIHARDFDWDGFDPSDPYSFVDDQTVNGRLLCADHHRLSDEGIHNLPFPLWVVQRYAKEGYRFSSVEIIHHDQDAG